MDTPCPFPGVQELANVDFDGTKLLLHGLPSVIFRHAPIVFPGFSEIGVSSSHNGCAELSQGILVLAGSVAGSLHDAVHHERVGSERLRARHILAESETASELLLGRLPCRGSGVRDGLVQLPESLGKNALSAFRGVKLLAESSGASAATLQELGTD